MKVVQNQYIICVCISLPGIFNSPDNPGIPFFVSNSLDTITISWSPLGLQTVTYTVNMRPDDGVVWMNATCKESIQPNQCIVIGTTAEVLGLEENVLYQFRVYANYKGVKSAPSLPSEAWRTAGDVECSYLDLDTFLVPSANRIKIRK